MKILIGLGFVVILLSLGAAGFFMLRRPDEGERSPAARSRMARALAVRVGVSITLFVLVLLAHLLGWIQPTGVPLR